jgi:hypothetical protein
VVQMNGPLPPTYQGRCQPLQCKATQLPCTQSWYIHHALLPHASPLFSHAATAMHRRRGLGTRALQQCCHNPVTARNNTSTTTQNTSHQQPSPGSQSDIEYQSVIQSHQDMHGESHQARPPHATMLPHPTTFCQSNTLTIIPHLHLLAPP